MIDKQEDKLSKCRFRILLTRKPQYNLCFVTVSWYKESHEMETIQLYLFLPFRKHARSNCIWPLWAAICPTKSIIWVNTLKGIDFCTSWFYFILFPHWNARLVLIILANHIVRWSAQPRKILRALTDRSPKLWTTYCPF